MGTPISGTNLVAPVVPFNTDDIYPTHFSLYGSGGLRSVADLTARDAIPALRREEGMLVYVASTQLFYQLQSDLVTWVEFSGGGGSSLRVTQVAHGFTSANIGMPVRFNGTLWVPAKADTVPDAESPGLILKINSVDEFVIIFIGSITALPYTVIPGAVYFLSGTNAGTLEVNPPVIPGQVDKPMLLAIGPNAGVVVQYRGMVVPPTPPVLNGQVILVTAGSNYVLDSVSLASLRTLHWAVTFVKGTNILTLEVLAHHDGTNVFDVRPVSLENGAGPFDVAVVVDISTGFLRLVASASSTGWVATWNRVYGMGV